MAKRKPKPRSTESAEFGKEPSGLDFNTLSVTQNAEAFNYYNYRFNARHARDVLSEKHPEIEWNSVKGVDWSTTFAWMYKLEARNCILTESMIAKRNEFLEKAKKYVKSAEKKVEEKPLSTYPDKRHLATFDDIEDHFYRTFNLVESVDKVKVLLSTLNRGQVNEILARMKILAAELELIASDKEVKEAYKIYNSSNIRVAKKFFQTLIEHVEFTAAAKKTSAPRKKKAIPVEKKLQHLKFLKSSDEFKLVSVNPEKLLGSKVVWLFNTKTRDLNRLESADGFDLKGTTLTNGASTKVRKIRKPEMIKPFSESSLRQMDKEFSSLKVNERDGNYRINSDTIILKAA